MLKIIQLTKIIPDPDQPRNVFSKTELFELKSSIEKQGILSPIIVESNYQEDNYLLIDGERRYRCAKELNLEKVPVTIIEGPLSYKERTEKRFHVQEQHHSWTELDKAKAIYEYKKATNKTLAEIAEALNLQVPKVHGYLSVTEFTESGKKLINAHEIDFTYLIFLIRIVKHYQVISDLEQSEIEEKIIARLSSNEFENLLEFQMLSKLLGIDENNEIKLKFLTDESYKFKMLLDDSKLLQADEMRAFYRTIAAFDEKLASWINTKYKVNKTQKELLESIQSKINSIL